jgi:hypothetical protein
LVRAVSTAWDWLPGTSKPPPLRCSVCLAARGAATITVISQAPTTHQRRRVRNAERLNMNDRMRYVIVIWLASQFL